MRGARGGASLEDRDRAAERGERSAVVESPDGEFRGAVAVLVAEPDSAPAEGLAAGERLPGLVGALRREPRKISAVPPSRWPGPSRAGPRRRRRRCRPRTAPGRGSRRGARAAGPPAPAPWPVRCLPGERHRRRKRCRKKHVTVCPHGSSSWREEAKGAPGERERTGRPHSRTGRDPRPQQGQVRGAARRAAPAARTLRASAPARPQKPAPSRNRGPSAPPRVAGPGSPQVLRGGCAAGVAQVERLEPAGVVQLGREQGLRREWQRLHGEDRGNQDGHHGLAGCCAFRVDGGACSTILSSRPDAVNSWPAPFRVNEIIFSPGIPDFSPAGTGE